MTHKCELCNFETNDKSNFNKHTKTKSHLLKKNQLTTGIKDLSSMVVQNDGPCRTKDQIDTCQESNDFDSDDIIKYKVIKCKYCFKEFNATGYLSRHLNRCKDKLNYEKEQEINKLAIKKEQEINQLNLQKEQEIQKLYQLKETEKINEINHLKIESLSEKVQLLTNENLTLREQVNQLKYIIQATGVNAKTNINSLTFVINNYQEAPNLIKLEDNCLEEYNADDDYFVERLINYHENQNLDKYLGDIIIKIYKKEDAAKQSLWNTDSNRLNYLIKEILNNKSGWIVDKKGIKTKKYIIDPLLTKIKPYIQSYLDQKNSIFSELEQKEMIKTLSKMKVGSCIVKEIQENILSNNILKYMAPHFFLNKGDDLLLK